MKAHYFLTRDDLTQIVYSLENPILHGYGSWNMGGGPYESAEEAEQAASAWEDKHMAAKALGSIRTEKKSASSRENGKLGGRPRKYLNICERYGEGYAATLKDYRDLNPDGIFEVHGDGIREYFGNGSTWELIATR